MHTSTIFHLWIYIRLRFGHDDFIFDQILLFHVEESDVSHSVALTANFIFVARDSKTGKAAAVNRLSPETESQKFLFEEAEARSKFRKKKRVDRRELENGEVNRLEALLAEGRIFCDMPALADRNSILLRDTRLENALICQPQQRNIHGRIFGGFLMHRAFELAFSTAYVFAGLVPCFLEVDHVDFLRPVSTFLLSMQVLALNSLSHIGRDQDPELDHYFKHILVKNGRQEETFRFNSLSSIFCSRLCFNLGLSLTYAKRIPVL